MKRFEYIEDIHRRIFAAMLANLDDSVGAVLAKLESRGLKDRTLVVFLSDNGGPTRELTSSNAPLRGEKGQVFEGGIRVPFMAAWPGVLPAGRVYQHPIIATDIYATAATVAGAPVPEERKLDGVNLMPYLTGKATGRPHEVLFWRLGERTAVRVGDYKLLRNPTRGGTREWQLYNLTEDISESNDLAKKNLQKRQELLGVWKEMNGQMVEPAW
jgi:arylsulfatase B